MLTRGTGGSLKKRARKGGGGSPSFIICRSKYFSTTAIETATAIYLSRPEDLLTQIELGGDSEVEGDFSGNMGEKGV